MFLGNAALWLGIILTLCFSDYLLSFLLGIFLTLLGAFLLFWYIVLLRKTSPQEKFIREQFYKTTGYYIMPEWMLADTFYNFYDSMKENYIKRFKSDNWQEIIKTLNPNEDDFAISFCLTYMENHLNNKPNNILFENYQTYLKK